MKISILMDNFPMAYLETLKQELNKFDLSAEVNVLGRDVLVTDTLNDVVKVQILAICCDRFRYGGGQNDDSSVSG